VILAILQARMSSSRLPGKVLKPILGQPMILRQIERIRQACRLDRLVMATSTDASDDVLVRVSEAEGVECARGDLDDVLDRYYQVARKLTPAHVVRLTGDCPLLDPEAVDELIAFHVEGGFDYSSNALDELTLPNGLDAEVMRFECLERAWREARLPSEREHVTPYLYNHRELFRLGSYRVEQDLSHMRWTVDEPDDLEFVRRVYESLYAGNPRFRMRDVVALVQREPALATINSRFERNEGLKRSLVRDRECQAGSYAQRTIRNWAGEILGRGVRRRLPRAKPASRTARRETCTTR
jgi:spore coat polysaccharide biosynthesis protein SpsF